MPGPPSPPVPPPGGSMARFVSTVQPWQLVHLRSHVHTLLQNSAATLQTCPQAVQTQRPKLLAHSHYSGC